MSTDSDDESIISSSSSNTSIASLQPFLPREPLANSELYTENFESVENYAEHIGLGTFRAALREFRRLIVFEGTDTGKRPSWRDLLMARSLSVFFVSWLVLEVVRYVFFTEGKLIIREAAPPKPFFPLDCGFPDLYRGNGASYPELYNKADITVVMFYAPWSLHSMEARDEFVRVSKSFQNDIHFMAVNCDAGKCKRSFKLYSYPVLLALTSSSDVILFDDAPVAELIHRWIVKLQRPIQRFTDVDDPRLSDGKYDLVVFGYFPVKDQQVSLAYRRFELAARKCRDRVLFGITVDPLMAEYYRLNESQVRILSTSSAFQLDEEKSTSTAFNEFINSEVTAHRFQVVEKIRREHDHDGGKSTQMHDLVKDTKAAVILISTDADSLRNGNVEAMRKIATEYVDCSNWGQIPVDITRYTQSEPICSVEDAMIDKCCGFAQENNVCKMEFSGPIVDVLKMAEECSATWNAFPTALFVRRCCRNTHKGMQLDFERRVECRMRENYAVRPQPSLQPRADIILNSRGLSCRTNRTLRFASFDRRFAFHFMRSWNINATDPRDQLVIISSDDQNIYSKPVENIWNDLDEMLNGYANESLNPTVFDESRRQSVYSMNGEKKFAKDEVETDEEEAEDGIAYIERLTAETFRTKILNETKRTFAAVVLVSGGSWHGPSVAITPIIHTVRRQFAAFESLIRFFIVDGSRNSLPYAYDFDRLPVLLHFPSPPYPITQSAMFPTQLHFTVPNLMAFLLARAAPELRFRMALRSCSSTCLASNRRRLRQFEEAVRSSIRRLRLRRRKYSTNGAAAMLTLRRRKLQHSAASYLQNVLRLLEEAPLSAHNETMIVRDTLLIRWILSNSFSSSKILI